ncbi:hypothetical protein BO83DRAFT_382510 [Aspergillus eucalypticola CBS 122712]|uniref:Uncharacterized protein n=1 Tax=Aspergillus eucalypticola (strain CBS 122712 / IBT 29274) TaxID=1448314 RepID=A0A317UUD9_ASPEC|nr:uncharacterized protein BO83DRAFT_382510 [Aspergillus eucalypticola CBS 122712]PWY63660.1 hypothetical protein BO83DRAFT_382510 [Aspergillus eucalypticola CBS 122712]
MRRPDDRNSRSNWGYGAAEGEMIGRVSAGECRSDVKLMDLILGCETYTLFVVLCGYGCGVPIGLYNSGSVYEY